MGTEAPRHVDIDLTRDDPPSVVIRITAGQSPAMFLNHEPATPDGLEAFEVLSRWLAEIGLLAIVAETSRVIAALGGGNPQAN